MTYSYTLDPTEPKVNRYELLESKSCLIKVIKTIWGHTSQLSGPQRAKVSIKVLTALHYQNHLHQPRMLILYLHLRARFMVPKSCFKRAR